MHERRRETVWKVGWRGVNEARSLACNAKIRSPCPSMLASVAPVWCPSGLSRQSLYARLYPIKPHSKAFRLSAPRTPAELLPSPALVSTAEKSPEPTTSCLPAPRHQRASRVGFTLPPRSPDNLHALHHSLVGKEGVMSENNPKRAPVWCAGSPTLSIVFASLPRGLADLGQSPCSASFSGGQRGGYEREQP